MGLLENIFIKRIFQFGGKNFRTIFENDEQKATYPVSDKPFNLNVLMRFTRSRDSLFIFYSISRIISGRLTIVKGDSRSFEILFLNYSLNAANPPFKIFIILIKLLTS